MTETEKREGKRIDDWEAADFCELCGKPKFPRNEYGEHGCSEGSRGWTGA